jgi:hypothetical protein
VPTRDRCGIRGFLYGASMYRRAVVVAALLASAVPAYADTYAELALGLSSPIGGRVYRPQVGARLGARRGDFGAALLVDRSGNSNGGGDGPSYRRTRVLGLASMALGTWDTGSLALRLGFGIKYASVTGAATPVSMSYSRGELGPVGELGLVLELGRRNLRFVGELAFQRTAAELGQDGDGESSVDVRIGARFVF